MQQGSNRKVLFLGAIAVVVALIVVISFAEPASDEVVSVETQKIIHREAGGYHLYIPEIYFKSYNVGTTRTGGNVHTFYPGAVPLIKDAKEYTREQQSRNVRVLFYNANLPPYLDIDRHPLWEDFGKRLEHSLEGNIRYCGYEEIMGERYGLIHRTHPKGADVKNICAHDLWIEREADEFVSFILCGKADDPPGLRQQCSHRFYDERYYYEVSYFREVLPNWSLIRPNVLALFESFRSEETAREFLETQLPIAYQYQTGEGHDQLD